MGSIRSFIVFAGIFFQSVTTFAQPPDFTAATDTLLNRLDLDGAAGTNLEALLYYYRTRSSVKHPI
jgi:hypothetical protein